ncbi:translation factor [Canariomyces notabilis]|uniref:Threonylcarbamoyl-AMP synthase n=1 Tax=Canariomyces notabilis TaxID=2074819 RepID=A0AAN6TL46_9PEZI|nr:translation factor [Canariomyces arenarius]
MKTRILKVPLTSNNEAAFGRWATLPDGTLDLSRWEVPSSTTTTSSSSTTQDDDVLSPLREAAHLLRTTSTPVAFPTETVYGLGADATRSDAVRGIYAAKGRPSDNPLIVHISDLSMLRRLLQPIQTQSESESESKAQADSDPIPVIYHPLITRFWPGPLTILLPLPSNPTSSTPPSPSPSSAPVPAPVLAPEVSAGQPTFGARLPASPLARTLISLVGNPLAAPSANASTRPSPTCAQHVADDLAGRIELVLDGGVCDVGVESTVVDGLCDPPVVLRPGGVGVEELRSCPGWEHVRRGYGGGGESEGGGEKGPRAPGMKYKHYSPRARVVLFEVGGGGAAGWLDQETVEGILGAVKTVGVIRTGKWPFAGGLRTARVEQVGPGKVVNGEEDIGFVVRESSLLGTDGNPTGARVLDVDLGGDIKGVAHGLFAALRELDRLGADVILVEGVSDGDDIAAAVMNRLRKAASDIRA